MRPTNPTSRVQQAIHWLDENPGTPANQAAKKFGITAPALCVALRNRKKTKHRRCPTCDQIVTEELMKKIKDMQ